ncbi:MAG: hypothetical protein GX609_04620 [Actinomycetales bacterium]|jgi:hypothetical protein|nr:hypothetical protein [Actinomycetales bacterium]
MDDERPLDPEAGAAIVEAQRARVEASTAVDPRVLFGAWGLAWLLGFGLLWAAALDEPLVPVDLGVALAVFFALLAAAGVVTAVHIATRSRGVRGMSARQGALYGWGWFLGFAVVGALAHALRRAGASEDVVSLVMMATSVLLVGALYMAGGALWDSISQWALGAVITVSTVVALVVGLPHAYLVMSLGGGGAMLVAAGVEALRRRRARGH